jgi:hypothetical protein
VFAFQYIKFFLDFNAFVQNKAFTGDLAFLLVVRDAEADDLAGEARGTARA